MSAEELSNQNRELLAMMSATLWVLEHPDVNKINFAGNPQGLAKRIRARLDVLGCPDISTSKQDTEMQQ